MSIIWNIGGNHILQNAMESLEKNLEKLKEIFPNSWNCLIPPIHMTAISMLNGLSVSEIKGRVDHANSLISKIWNIKTIDTYSPFLNPSANGEPYWFVLEDLVHFSEDTDKKIRIPLIISKVK